MKLKLIGYWNGGGLIENDIWPNPKHFVEEFAEEEKECVLNYFHNAIPMPYATAGVSECRFCKKVVGAGEFTDGKYVWPEGLPHYVKEHDVKLPDEFLEHALNNTIDPDLIIDIEALEIDIEWWKSKKNVQEYSSEFDNEISKEAAEKLVQEYLHKDVQGFSIIPEATVESHSCFAIFHQSDKYIASKKTEDIAIGYGAVIVSKSNGKLYQTGSGHSIKDAIDSFEKYGNPFIEKNTSILNLSLDRNDKFQTKELLSFLKTITGKGVLEAKQVLEDLNNGGILQIKNDFKIDIDTLEQLHHYGFKIDHPWEDYTL